MQIELEGCKIDVPPIEFDVVYILLHAVHHLYSSGVGLRQICDWVCLLHNYRGKINQENVTKLLKKTGMTNAARIFGAVAVNYMGLEKEDLVVGYDPEDEKYAEILINDIWNKGNFGQYDKETNQRHANIWKKRWYLYKLALKRAALLRKVAPKEALWTPYGMTEFLLKNFYFKFTKGKHY